MLTYKTKLVFPSQKARDFWVERMSLVRDCYNFASKIAFEEKLPLGMMAYHRRLYRAERAAFPSLPAQMCIKVNRQVMANYKTARENKAELEKPLVMKNPSVCLDERLYSNLSPESFRLSTGDGKRRSEVRFVLYPKFREMAAAYPMRDPVLTYDDRTGNFYACVPFVVPAVNEPECEEKCLGVDLGIKRIATMSDGTAMTDKGYLARRRRIRHVKRVFQRHKSKSHSARRKLNRLRRKEFNYSKNFCHKVANEILSHDCSVIVMEDLSKIKRKTSKTKEGFKRRRHNNMMSQVPFFQLKQILTYKAPLRGRRVETVHPHYTSQEDCRTQSRDGCVRKGCRFYTADGKVFDADWNAAINICNRHRPTPFSLPLDGSLNFVGRHRQHANRGKGHARPASPQALAVGS